MRIRLNSSRPPDVFTGWMEGAGSVLGVVAAVVLLGASASASPCVALPPDRWHAFADGPPHAAPYMAASSFLEGNRVYVFDRSWTVGEASPGASVLDVCTGKWEALGLEGLPSASARPFAGVESPLQTPIFTADEILFFVPGLAARYHLRTKRWQAINLDGAPDFLTGATRFWTGQKLVVYGGSRGQKPCGNGFCPDWSGEGAIYDLATDRWTPMSAEGAPKGIVVGVALPVFSSAIASANGKVFVATGAGRRTVRQDPPDFGVYDLGAGQWDRSMSERLPLSWMYRAFHWLPGRGLVLWPYPVDPTDDPNWHRSAEPAFVDPATGAVRALPPLPVPLVNGPEQVAISGGRLALLNLCDGRGARSFVLDGDSWKELPHGRWCFHDGSSVFSDGSSVVLTSGDAVQTFDLERRKGGWAQLPTVDEQGHATGLPGEVIGWRDGVLFAWRGVVVPPPRPRGPAGATTYDNRVFAIRPTLRAGGR